jgi:hypothetical protein
VAVYSQRKGIAPAAFRFMLDGKRISGADTPASLDLSEGDSVEVVYEQTGGN